MSTKPTTMLPVFALDEATTWDDLENAMEGSIRYQTKEHGKFLSLMLFAPLTPPKNPDTWEPMATLPNNLLVISIERKMDSTVLKALQRTEATVGEIRHAASFAGVQINYSLPLADVYQQMTAAEVFVYTLTKEHKDDASFFFLRGGDAVRAFAKELRNVTR